LPGVVKHYASPDFWHCYQRLPESIRDLADKNFELLKADARHPSLRLKKVGEFWSARVGIGYRAVGRTVADGIVWFWIGSHADYDQLISG
jgi:hypothetical protein